MGVPPPQDDNRPHTAIVGAGIAGCSLAYLLSRAGARVSLLEAETVGAGASGVPVALLNPHRGRTARASELDKAGLRTTRSLVDMMEGEGVDTGARFTGVLRIASNAKQVKKWRRLGSARWLEPARVPAPYHAPFGALLVEGGWLYPRRFLGALVSGASARGTRLREHCRVKTMMPTPEGWRLVTTDGDLTADKVVLCVGASEELKAALGMDWGLERLAGDVIGMNAPLPLPYPIAGAIYGAQRGGRVYMGGNHRPAGTSDPDAAERLRASSGWFVKALKDAEITSVWTGVRAKRADNQPLVQELRPGLWHYGALAGRGFLCAAHLSANLTAQLLGSGAGGSIPR